jgi:cell division protein ZapA
MGQVVVNVNGRSYRFDCGDGEEARLDELAAFVRARIDALTQQYGHVGSERLMLMAALLITDELLDARTALAAKAAPPEKAAPAEKKDGKTPAEAAAVQPAAQKREQEAIRSEHKRRVAAGEV